ncbi:aldo/keto reductase [Novosphingobium endophyticum]|uniref:Aldo/keto reductase n=1 Tax=Novosphingobium endophyticum TaxID=1955250 RepID=A0A916TSG5_9SPHN|nr:aldo/keto reductase [Novosphingobium endophyticum]GGB96697.1 aldo/keto reductase [Novosphingobium endophyticum]
MNTHLPTRKIGPFTVSAMGLGCMNLSHAYLPRPEPEQAERLLLHALDAGVTLFDTAALYGSGRNEELLGRTLMHRRGEFTLSSKCVLAELDGKRGLDGSPGAIARVLEDSLRRLRVDHIDLYYLHRLDRNVPIEDSVGALVRAVEAGKIGAIGLSEMSAATLRRAHAVHPIAAMQTEYSPWTRNVEIAVLDACAELDVALVAFSPLARGLLAGGVGPEGVAAEDIRAAMPRFQPPHLERNLALAARLEGIAREVGCTPAQLTLAWVLSRGDHVVPIPGTTSSAHLDEDLAALSIEVPAEALARIDTIFTPEAVSGPRYTRGAQAQIDTEVWETEPLA